MLLSNTDFDYNKATDSLILKRLPKSYCALTSMGIAVNGVLTYQVPVVQIEHDSYLWVPRRSRRGELLWSEDRKKDKLPENPRIIDLVGKAFDDVRAPLPGFSVNIRLWNQRRSPKIYEQLKDSPYFSGFFFEGGTKIMSAERPKLDNFADGMAWVLRNTDEKIYMLMPGFWEGGQLDNEQEIDQLIDRLRQMILSLNTKLGERLKLAEGQNAICTSRMHLIPASYGFAYPCSHPACRKRGQARGNRDRRDQVAGGNAARALWYAKLMDSRSGNRRACIFPCLALDVLFNLI